MRAIGVLLVVAGVGILISAAAPSDARASGSAPASRRRSRAVARAPDRGGLVRRLHGRRAARAHATSMATRCSATGCWPRGSSAPTGGSWTRGCAASSTRSTTRARSTAWCSRSSRWPPGYNLARARAGSEPASSAPRARAGRPRLRAMRPDLARPGAQPLLQPAPGGRGDGAGAGAQRRALAGRGRGRRRGGAGERRLPRLLRATTSGGTTMAADGALSYHALTVGFYARAIKLLGPAARPPAARALLDRLTRASWALAGPDGDISYFGRSQEQAWSLALTAYGADQAAEAAGQRVGPPLPRARPRALERLRELHAGGPDGLYLTPAFREDRSGRDRRAGGLRLGQRLHRLHAARPRVGGRAGRPARARSAALAPTHPLHPPARPWPAPVRRPLRRAGVAGRAAAREHAGADGAEGRATAAGAWRDVVLHGATVAAAGRRPACHRAVAPAPTCPRPPAACGSRRRRRRPLGPHRVPPHPPAAAADRQALRARPGRVRSLPGSRATSCSAGAFARPRGARSCACASPPAGRAAFALGLPGCG